MRVPISVLDPTPRLDQRKGHLKTDGVNLFQVLPSVNQNFQLKLCTAYSQGRCPPFAGPTQLS